MLRGDENCQVVTLGGKERRKRASVPPDECAPPHRLRCLVRRLARHALPFRCDAGRDALDENCVGHAPGTLPEFGAGDDALELVGRHQCSPVRNAHAKHLSKSLRAIKPSAGCRAAALSSSAAHHGSGGGRSRSVTYGSSHSSASWWISRQTRAPHLLCPPTDIATTGSSAAIVTVRQRPVRAYPVSTYGVRRIGTRAAGSPLRSCSMRRRQSASASSETSSRYDRREWPVVSVTCSIQRATVLIAQADLGSGDSRRAYGRAAPVHPR